MKKCFLIGFSVAIAFNAWAQAPEIFRYQGRLVDGTNLVNANLPMSFKLYDAPSSGNLLYEDSSSVLVVDGLYATDIGDDTAFGSLTDALTYPAVYLELTIDGETLSPRERLASVPYALNAQPTTPSGMIVLSETADNTELEAQGYSAYYEPIEKGIWTELKYDTFPDLMSPTSFLPLLFKNEITLFSSMDRLFYSSENGKTWRENTLPMYSFTTMSPIVFNDMLFLYENSGGASDRVLTTSDLLNWQTWTNNFPAEFQLSKLKVFKDKIWSFGYVYSSNNDTNLVFSSTDGSNWTQEAIGDDWTAYAGEIVTSKNKMWIKSTRNYQSADIFHVWSSTNGITWRKSLSTAPNDTYTKTVAHNDALWCFTADSTLSTYGSSCWKSTDDGDSWFEVSTELPVVFASGYGKNIAVFDEKLWIWGTNNPGSATPITAVMWSIDGIQWTTSLITISPSEYSTIVQQNNGRLWFISPSAMYGAPYLQYLGGPKETDGLYYYKKD